MAINTHVTVEKIISKGDYGSIFLARDQNSHERVKCACSKKGYEEGRSYHILGEHTNHPKYGSQIRILRSRKKTYTVNFYDALSQSDIWPSLTPNRLTLIREYANKHHISEASVLDSPWKSGVAISDISGGVNLSRYWSSIKAHKGLCTLLLEAGLPIDKAFTLSQGFSRKSRESAIQNPYHLLYSNQVDLNLVKRVLANLNKDETPAESIMPLYYKHLGESASKGCSGEAISSIAKKVGNDSGIDIHIILDAISNEATHLFGEDYSVTQSIYRKEIFVANKIASLLSNKSNHNGKNPLRYEGDGFLTNEQVEAVNNSLKHSFSMITGGPGTGKTTTTKEVIKNLEKQGYETEIVTLSGKAADRASEASGKHAQTIHSFLGITPTSVSSTKRYSNKAIVVDEASMVDINLFYMLLKSIDDSCKIILVGDINQLESIEPGAILEDISKSIPEYVTHLSKVRRFSEESNINAFANSILEGEIKYEKANGLYTYQSNDDNHQHNTNKKIIESYLKRNGNIEGLQIISPTWKGINGVTSLNEIIQDMIPRKDEKVLFLGKSKFYENDKVISRAEIPASGISNGQIMKIDAIDYDNNSLSLSSGDREYKMSISDVSKLSLAFCITGHSSQGSEFKNVLFSITPQSEFFADKKMLYTIATRPKENLIVTTPTGVMEKMLNNNNARRKTFLADILSGYIKQKKEYLNKHPSSETQKKIHLEIKETYTLDR